MWEFVWKFSDQWGAIVVAGALFVWLSWLTRHGPPPGPRKEEQWPFGENPRNKT